MRHINNPIKLPYGWCSLLQLFTRLVPSPENLSTPRPYTLPNPQVPTLLLILSLSLSLHTHTQPFFTLVLLCWPCFCCHGYSVEIHYGVHYFQGTLTPTL
jgi:hypothetical protein